MREEWNIREMVIIRHSVLYSTPSTFPAYSRAIWSFSAQGSTTLFRDDTVGLWRWHLMHLGSFGQTATTMGPSTGGVLRWLDLPYVSCGECQHVMEDGNPSTAKGDPFGHLWRAPYRGKPKGVIQGDCRSLWRANGAAPGGTSGKTQPISHHIMSRCGLCLCMSCSQYG